MINKQCELIFDINVENKISRKHKIYFVIKIYLHLKENIEMKKLEKEKFMLCTLMIQRQVKSICCYHFDKMPKSYLKVNIPKKVKWKYIKNIQIIQNKKQYIFIKEN